MNYQRFLISALAVFGAIFGLDFIVHNLLLANMYHDLPATGLPGGMLQIWPMLLSQLLFALAFVFIYTRNYEGVGLEEGVRYGFYIGILLAAIDLGMYSYLPVPLSLVGWWMAASMIKSLLLGMVTAVLYHD